MSENIISLQGVTKEFDTKNGKVVALKGINLDIKQGDSYGIIGLSGAGKSTLVRTINLLEQPTEGKVLFKGESLTGLKTKELNQQRHKISMIFQQFNLLMQRDAIGNVCFPMELAGVPKSEARKRAMELLKVVDLEERAHAYPAQLSGGQKQRVAIARALASNPEVILCDEATSALDPKTTRSILALLKKINEERGITLVVITHEMEVIKQLCKKVAIIEMGEIVEKGEVKEIFANPKTQAAKKLFFPEGNKTNIIESNASPGDKIRIVFDKYTVQQPIIAKMILEIGEPVNLIFADLDVVEDEQNGQMVIKLSDNPEIAEKQKQFLIKEKLEFIELGDGEEAE